MAYCYAELAVSSPAVADTVASWLRVPAGDGQAELAWVAWMVYQSKVVTNPGLERRNLASTAKCVRRRHEELHIIGCRYPTKIRHWCELKWIASQIDPKISYVRELLSVAEQYAVQIICLVDMNKFCYFIVTTICCIVELSRILNAKCLYETFRIHWRQGGGVLIYL